MDKEFDMNASRGRTDTTGWDGDFTDLKANVPDGCPDEREGWIDACTPCERDRQNTACQVCGVMGRIQTGL